MDLSIFRGSALNSIKFCFYESMCMNTINMGNVETAVKSTWTFLELGGKKLLVRRRSVLMEQTISQMPLLKYDSMINTLFWPHVLMFFLQSLRLFLHKHSILLGLLSKVYNSSIGSWFLAYIYYELCYLGLTFYLTYDRYF